MIAITDGNKVSIKEILAAREQEQVDVSGVVNEIIAKVKAEGDSALLAYTRQFDKAELTELKVTASEIEEACLAVGDEFLAILQAAAENIRAFHQKQVRQGFVMAEKPGVVMGQRIIPLETVGIYVPGGTAPLPSTVLMDGIPAQIAGVKNIIMATPPGANGKIDSSILAAAKIAGVTEIYKMGGAQAIAALSYGTQSVPKVDKIVGPGNQYVATAKRLVYGQVDIDMIAGPSDILVVADESAAPQYVAADMLGQAEHDPMAAAVLVTTSRKLAQEVQAELERVLPKLSRKNIAEASLKGQGKIILASTIEQAVEISNALAPEHLELCVNDPFALLPLVKNAGSVFMGHNTPEALGDYFAGPNHTLPTAGTARFYSPLSVDDFVKKSSYLYYSKQALEEAAEMVQTFANKEQLQAHANSVAIRANPQKAL